VAASQVSHWQCFTEYIVAYLAVGLVASEMAVSSLSIHL